MIDYKIGDCREVLKTLPEKSIHCCVTSPPYYGLRDYGVDGQIGLEKTPDEYVNELVNVFREVKRVLRDDGTLWLNLGDSYASNNKAGSKLFGNPDFNENRPSREKTKTPGKSVPSGLKQKDLIGIPWRVAFALQLDGWYLRSDIIWSKPNPMPESVTDRPTKAHEYVFLLSKSEKYFYDNEAVKEETVTPIGDKSAHRFGAPNGKFVQTPGRNKVDSGEKWVNPGIRNKRSVWTIPTKPYSGAHFATFPLALIEPCLKAGCPVGGTALDPFGGSGTVGEWCRHNGRNAILIELNPEYGELIKERALMNYPELSSFGDKNA